MPLLSPRAKVGSLLTAGGKIVFSPVSLYIGKRLHTIFREGGAIGEAINGVVGVRDLDFGFACEGGLERFGY